MHTLDTEIICPICKDRGSVKANEVLFNFDTNTIYRGENSVKLLPKQFELVYILYSSSPFTVDYDIILNKLYGVWGEDYPDKKVIHVWASQLRKLLLPLNMSIHNYSRVGFSLKVGEL